LCALALRADAERAALARIRRDPAALKDVRRHADGLLADAREATDAAASVTPVAAGWRALAEAEHTRAAGTARPEEWAAADAWQRLGQPYRVAYCRRWQAEALVTAGAARPAAAVPAREAYTVATRLGALPLRRDLELLAEDARLELAPSAPEDVNGAAGRAPGLDEGR
jgi:hypothetical protein